MNLTVQYAGPTTMNPGASSMAVYQGLADPNIFIAYSKAQCTQALGN